MGASKPLLRLGSGGPGSPGVVSRDMCIRPPLRGMKMDPHTMRRARSLAEMADIQDRMGERSTAEAIGDYRPRLSDIVISPFSKCGTTWLQQTFHTCGPAATWISTTSRASFHGSKHLASSGSISKRRSAPRLEASRVIFPGTRCPGVALRCFAARPQERLGLDPPVHGRLVSGARRRRSGTMGRRPVCGRRRRRRLLGASAVLVEPARQPRCAACFRTST